MSDRADYYFRQKVTEAELDLGFELLEKADRNFAADLGIYGVVSGAVPAPHSPVADLSIDLTAPGRAYDNLGQRIFFGTGQTVSCAVDLVGLPTDVSSAGNERWLGVFLRFRRLLSDPRTDGNSQQVFFRRDESFELVVRQAPEGAVGSAPRVALQPDELLVCDVRRRPGQTQIVAADIEITRRQAFIFAQGTSVAVLTGLWSILQPAAATAQAAFDEVDAELKQHFDGTGRRHAAAAITSSARGFVAATTVQGAINELVDDLSSSTSGAAGAGVVGADAVAGTPNALASGTVDAQLASLLGFLNAHQGAVTGAHNASAIAAQPHGFISGTNVQAQLQELLTDLAATTAGQAGSQRIGSEALGGSPNALPQGAVKDQLASLLGFLNVHLTQYTDAHDAVNISVSDYSGMLNAVNVEDALNEIAGGFQVDHFLPSATDGGQHKTIRQPNFGGSKALLWDALGTGGAGSRFRVYADGSTIWFTANAYWDGSAWNRDNTGYGSGGIRFSGYDFEAFHQPAGTGTFASFERRWRLPMSASTNSAFEMVGPVGETGRLGCAWHNSGAASGTVASGGSCTFRNRFPATPSSITFSVNYYTVANTEPTLVAATRDGFGYFGYRTLNAGQWAYWMGTYIATA
jgi:hypothetical protein